MLCISIRVSAFFVRSSVAITKVRVCFRHVIYQYHNTYVDFRFLNATAINNITPRNLIEIIQLYVLYIEAVAFHCFNLIWKSVPVRITSSDTGM
jgi:hypothetical protein